MVAVCKSKSFTVDAAVEEGILLEWKRTSPRKRKTVLYRRFIWLVRDVRCAKRGALHLSLRLVRSLARAFSGNGSEKETTC